MDVDDAVFMNAYIPRSLHELPNSFEEARRIAAGEREQVHPHHTTLSAVHEICWGRNSVVHRPISARLPSSNASVPVVPVW